MSVEIRPARPGEAGLVLNFVRELAAYEKLADEVEADEGAIDDALFAKPPKAFCDIAEWDGEPVGFALWFVNFSSFRGRNGLYLEDIFVRPAHRGRGIGRAILRKLAERCLAQGWTRLEWAVLDWNQPPSTSTRRRAQRFCGTGRSAGSAEARSAASAGPTRRTASSAPRRFAVWNLCIRVTH